jgi:AmmeMemoRadiSam system protein A
MTFDLSLLQPLACTEREQQALLRLGREAIQAAIHARTAPDLPQASLTPTLSTPAATFVTLNLAGKLRGCVGTLVVRDPLHRSVARNAIGAALRDTRFPPVTREELKDVKLHISILSSLVPVPSQSAAELLSRLTPGVDGVVLRQAGRTATYLPQVWQTFPDREAFLESLCRKAGVAASAWSGTDAEVLIYRVSEFGDEAHP